MACVPVCMCVCVCVHVRAFVFLCVCSMCVCSSYACVIWFWGPRGTIQTVLLISPGWHSSSNNSSTLWLSQPMPVLTGTISTVQVPLVGHNLIWWGRQGSGSNFWSLPLMYVWCLSVMLRGTKASFSPHGGRGDQQQVAMGMLKHSMASVQPSSVGRMQCGIVINSFEAEMFFVR